MLTEIGTLATGAVAGAKAEATISNRNSAGVLVGFDNPLDVAKVTLTVELQSKESGNIILIPEMPIFPLLERADIRMGVGFGSALVELAEADAGDKSITRIAALITAYGSVVLSGEDKLLIRLKVTGAVALTGNVRALSLDPGPVAERLLKISEKQRTDASFSDAEEILLFNSATDAEDDPLATATLGDCKVTVRGPNGEHQFDARDAWDLTRATGRIESEGTRRTTVVYEDIGCNAPGAPVTVTLSGTGAGSYVLYGLERYTNQQRAANTTREVVSELTKRATDLREKSPEKFAALAIQNRLKLAA